MTQALRQLPATAAPTQRPVAPPLPLARRWDLRQSAMLLALLAVWLCTRPWSGLWHDSRLYAAQALHLLHPQQFRNDLFFLFGSQDSFTVFSPLYGAAIQAFGLDAGSRLLHLLGSALWLCGAYLLLAVLLRGVMRWVALAWLLLLPTEYDPVKTFALAEPYLTPRVFAEALGLLAIACLLRGKARWLALLLPLSLAMHPLMTLGTIGFCLLYLATGARRYGLLLGACAAVAAAALAAAAASGVAPFDRLLHSMDAAWFAQVVRLTSIVTWDGWSAAEMAGRTAVAFSLVLTAAWLSGGWRARLYYCIASVGALGLLASWLGTGLFHNVLLMQLQPWRALWLVQLGAVVALASLLAAFWQRGRLYQFLLTACVLGVFARDGYGALLAVPAGVALCWQAGRPAPWAVPDRVYGWLCVLLLVMTTVWLAEVDAQATAQFGVRHWIYVAQPGDPLEWSMTLLRLGGGALLGLALLLGIWRCSGQRRWLPGLAAAGVAGLALAAALWLGLRYDTHRLKASEAGMQAVQAAFLPRIPPQATVYWEGELRFTWFVLQRSSYASLPQIYGMVFNRGTALEGARRLERLGRLGASDVVWGVDRDDTRRLLARLPQPGVAELEYVCVDPALDFVVLTRRLGTLAVAQADDAAFERRYFLYDCARLRGPVASL